MVLALRKRPVSAASIDAAIGRIEEVLTALGVREVSSDQIGELVMRELRGMDKVGYVRFASVYRNFEHVDEFADLIQEVRPETNGGVR
jgi:transcriptional repressor NrdR